MGFGIMPPGDIESAARLKCLSSEPEVSHRVDVAGTIGIAPQHIAEVTLPPIGAWLPMPLSWSNRMG